MPSAALRDCVRSYIAIREMPVPGQIHAGKNCCTSCERQYSPVKVREKRNCLRTAFEATSDHKHARAPHRPPAIPELRRLRKVSGFQQGAVQHSPDTPGAQSQTGQPSLARDVTARASSRPATLAQAISKMMPTQSINT